MNLLLDTGILGQLCHPATQTNRPVMDWVDAILEVDSNDRIFLPEVCDYEIRRELLRLCRKAPKYRASINRLDELCDLLEYLPLDTATMRKASEFWADVRVQGRPTAPDAALDGDVILAAQASLVGGTVVTTNRKHLSLFVPAWDRTKILWVYCFVCIRGAVDNLAFDWKGHFIVRDTQGRNWHCRQEVTLNSREEVEQNQILARLNVIANEMVHMYKKLFSSGHGTTEETKVNTYMTFRQIPLSQRELIEDLTLSLGADDVSDDQTDVQA